MADKKDPEKDQPEKAPKGFWEDPDVKVSSSWMKFEKTGDRVSGTIAKLGKKKWQDDSVGIEVTWVEDDVPTLTASQTMLKSALFNLGPNPGDHLTVELVAIEKRPMGKTLKLFNVTVKYQDGSEDSIDQTQTR